MRGGQRALAAGLGVLGLAVMACALLGPLATNVLRYRTSELALSQIRGGDLAALFVVGPLCLAVAVLALAGHRAAPVLALAPAVYAMYMYSQLIMGNEYLRVPGNVERFFPLLLGIVVLAGSLAVRAWGWTSRLDLPPTSRRFDRTVGALLLLIAAYLLLGIHAGSYLEAVRSEPVDPQYVGAPTAFWAVKLWDLAVVLPAAVAVGIGMLRHRGWARRPMYALLGGYLLLGCSVAGMAWTMYLENDPGGTLAGAVGATVVVAGMALASVPLYRPLLRAGGPPAQAVPADGPHEPDAATPPHVPHSRQSSPGAREITTRQG